MSMLRTAVVICVAACGGAKPSPASTGETSTCEPGRCLDDVKRLVAERRAEARACYDAGPNWQTSLVVINFAIGPDGKVIDATQGSHEGQLTEAAVVECIANVIRSLEFAPSAAGKTTRAYHHFEFAAKN